MFYQCRTARTSAATVGQWPLGPSRRSASGRRSSAEPSSCSSPGRPGGSTTSRRPSSSRRQLPRQAARGACPAGARAASSIRPASTRVARPASSRSIPSSARQRDERFAGLRLRRLRATGDPDQLACDHQRRRRQRAPSRRPRDVFVEFQDRDRVKATIVGWDVFDDVGVLRVDPKAHALTPLPLGDSSRVVVGEPVAAIGSPFGNENSLTVGVVSATQRSIESLTSRYNLVDAIQVDAPINHGNSGGPLFDARARDRDQRADPERQRQRGGRRFRRADQRRAPVDAGAARDREGRLRVRRHHLGGPHTRDREAVRLSRALRRGDHVGAARQSGGDMRACAAAPSSAISTARRSPTAATSSCRSAAARSGAPPTSCGP